MHAATKILFEVQEMTSRNDALEFCRNKKEFYHEDVTEGENSNTNVFTFKDGSILYIGFDNEIYTDNCSETIKMNNWD